MKKRYVLGFLFNIDYSQVALIEKLKPKWQKGKINGIGGKIERGETSLNAMIREFKEETGFDFKDWKYFASLYDGENFEVFIFCGHTTKILSNCISHIEEEKPFVCSMDWFNQCNDLIPNLKYLVPMAINKLQGVDKAHHFMIKEEYGI